MKNIFLLLLLCFTSCEKFSLEQSDVTLSGKYVISKIDITSVDQNTSQDSLYTVGSVYINPALPDPFDSIAINRFYWHMDYSTILLNNIGVTQGGRDKWEYGNKPDYIFYQILGNTTYSSGYLQFDYFTRNGSSRRLTFYIEDDGIESLQLKSSGAWFKGKFGEKQVMTLYLTRVGP
jgi:hypothetical protein